MPLITKDIILENYLCIVNSGKFGARSDGATPSNRQALSDNVPNFSSIDYNRVMRMVSYYYKKL
ncbi:hypothetical protein [Rickettsia endosymbiont of Oedothorax gibbosus]|uniref:hypothetical protein n=1 Tax=Rickettsia endosymbiont of Oedothorax gibbosus TaxID=931099 RepID=UPI00202428AD|nr:hypothetical protein [Rickettsia endosymbiont of Oedothorax gibbosus]